MRKLGFLEYVKYRNQGLVISVIFLISVLQEIFIDIKLKICMCIFNFVLYFFIMLFKSGYLVNMEI